MAQRSPLNTPPKPPKHIQTQVKLLPGTMERLEKEAEERMVAKSFLVEKALQRLFGEFDEQLHHGTG